MSDNKRYYWIKLKTDFFNQETIDFMLSQKNGCEYVVLYQMLCLGAANRNGELTSKVGEMLIPYDVDKIVRDTKYFDFDTVSVALELFKRLGLIYEEEGKVLKIANFNEMVGSEVSSAKRVREFRERQKALQCNNDVTQEIEYRDKSIDIDNKKEEIYKEEKFKKPTLEEVKKYCLDRENGINPQQFIDFYEAKGWMIGKNKMKDWKAAVRTWEKNHTQSNQPKEILPDWFDKEIEREEISEQEQQEFDDLLNSFS